MAENGLALSRIGQIGLPAQDIDRATAFYRDVLGMKYLFSAPPGLAFFDCGGVRLMLSSAEGEAPRASILYYKVDDIRAGTARLKMHGVKMIDEPHIIAQMPDHDLWMVFFHDSEENTVALMSEVPRD